jgi:hypothetical protein
MSLAVTHQNSQESESAEHEHEEEGGAEIGALSAGLMAGGGGGGAPMDAGTQAQMERSFGTDFSSVRVHENSAAAASVGAQAYARGTDIHFAPGQYDPSSASGRELLGHELAHVVQQGSAAGPVGPQGKGAMLGGSAALEREADIAGAAAARGERAHVSGAGSGIQFKGKTPKPAPDRAWLDAAGGVESGKIAQAHVEELKKRIAAQCELSFTNTPDLVKDLEEAASNKVKDVSQAELSDTKQKGDVDALAAKIAQRSNAVKNAVSGKSKSIADELVGADALNAFKDAAAAAFAATTVSRYSIKAIVLQQATSAAKRAATALDDQKYKDAKKALDKKLADEAGQLKTDLTTTTETTAEKRAKDATAKRKDADVDTKVTKIAKEAHEPLFKSLHDEIEKYVSDGLGANGASWFRSDQLREFRAQMKKSARKQAVKDIDTEVSSHTELGKARSRYVGMDAKMEAYDDAKESVNTALAEAATQLTDKLFADKHTSQEMLDEARRAAFAVYEDEGHAPAAKNAAIAAAKAYVKAHHDDIKNEAKARKNAIVKPPSNAPNPQVRQDLETEVVKQVETDQVGKKAVDAAIKGSSPEDGMSKFGHFLDFMVPERGDAIKFKVTLEVPAGPGNVLLEFQGDAERGTRERLVKEDSSGNKTIARDTQSLKFAAEIRVGYSGTFPGIKLQGALGFFLRSDAASTDMCMKALSYGIYRFLTGAIPPLANLWGGSDKKAQGMAQDPNDDLNDDVYRSELWAAMIEEEVFQKDKDARVDLGMSLSGGGEVDGGVAKAKGSLRFEGMRTYDKKALKQSIDKYNSAHPTGQQSPGGVSLGDDKFDKQGAKERRDAISGRTTGAFVLESEVEVNISGQKCVFGLKVKITPPDWEVELSGGIKISSSDPASKEARLYAGIASASQNGLKMIISMIRNLIDKDHAVAGVAGSITDGVTRTLVDVNNITGNKVGDMSSQAYQVQKGQEDFGNEGINSFFKGDKIDKSEGTKAGFQTESTYKVGIIFGNVKQFILKVDEVQSQKVKVGGPTGPGLNIEYEKSRRVGQIGVSDGRFHAEGMGVSTKT